MSAENSLGAEREIGTQKMSTIVEEISTLRGKLESQYPEICADFSPLSLLKNGNGQHQEEDLPGFTVMKDILTYLRSIHAHIELTLCELQRAGYGEKEIGEVRVEAEALHTALQQYDDRKRRLTRQLRDGSISAVNASAIVQCLSVEEGIQKQKRDELRQLEIWLREADALRRSLLSEAVEERSIGTVLSEHLQRLPTEDGHATEARVSRTKQRVRRRKEKRRKHATNGKNGAGDNEEKKIYFFAENLTPNDTAAMEQRIRHTLQQPLGRLFSASVITNATEFRRKWFGCEPRMGDYLFTFEAGACVLNSSGLGAPVIIHPHRKLASGNMERLIQTLEEITMQDPVAPSPTTTGTPS